MFLDSVFDWRIGNSIGGVSWTYWQCGCHLCSQVIDTFKTKITRRITRQTYVVWQSFFFNCSQPEMRSNFNHLLIWLALIDFLNVVVGDPKLSIYSNQDKAKDYYLINHRNMGLFTGEGFWVGLDRVCIPLPILLVSLQEHPDVMDNLPYHGPSYWEISRSLQVWVPSVKLR